MRFGLLRAHIGALWGNSPMSAAVKAPSDESGVSLEERQRKAKYLSAYSRFSRGLSSHDRARINGSAAPSWEGKRTFALPVNEQSAAYSIDASDPVIETLEELGALAGALPKIALWLNDKVGSLGSVMAIEQFGIAISRIYGAKNPRLEAGLIELAMGRSLRGNENGYAIARHFGLKPQTVHEMLGETCRSLNLPKPLSKSNTARYKKTQYRHHVDHAKPAS